MTFRQFTLAVAVAATAGLGGCDTIDNVEPRQSVEPEEATGSLNGVQSLLSSVYDGLQDQGHYGQQFMLVPEALADNITVPNQSSNRYPGFTTNRQNSHLNIWGGAYERINTLNLILANIDGLDLTSQANPDAVRARVRGEALFLRGLYYFDLARTKGYEPGQSPNGFDLSAVLRTTPTLTPEETQFQARSNSSETYTQVISDLSEAATLLTQSNRGSINFATPAAAYTLLARAYLYTRQWSQAEAAALEALAATNAGLVEDSGDGALLDAWLDDSHPESIFELEMTPSQDGDVTFVNASLQSLTDPTLAGGFFDAIATVPLVNAHEDGDARLSLYSQATLAGQAITYIRKYTGTTAPNVDRVPILRLPELYLILAEARAEQGNTSGALDALNTLRTARNLDELGDGADDGGDGNVDSASEIIDAVLQERRVEFAFEGQRFFDLKRRALDIPKPQLASGVLPYTDFRILAPIPSDQILSSNGTLVQNPGYSGAL